jgi:hypothetical protein
VEEMQGGGKPHPYILATGGLKIGAGGTYLHPVASKRQSLRNLLLMHTITSRVT